MAIGDLVPRSAADTGGLYSTLSLGAGRRSRASAGLLFPAHALTLLPGEVVVQVLACAKEAACLQLPSAMADMIDMASAAMERARGLLKQGPARFPCHPGLLPRMHQGAKELQAFRPHQPWAGFREGMRPFDPAWLRLPCRLALEAAARQGCCADTARTSMPAPSGPRRMHFINSPILAVPPGNIHTSPCR